ncbi:aldose epimerase family protein [Anaerolentibacter hominis]|uniref:aldose epimerase family protein n=1 Tax=Anaerolentibacter hominis TaxID=3079009 RepID=UPI0031B8A9CD
MGITVSSFGSVNGKNASLYIIENSQGMTVAVSDFGATLVSILVPDRNGQNGDVVLGYDSAGEYMDGAGSFGATIGRSGNRIAGAGFSLNGTEYRLNANDGCNNLHSGPDGYHKRMWTARIEEADNMVVFGLDSPDGDQGMPGRFQVEVSYRLREDNGLEIRYHGIPDQDTLANMTNHSYFNLAGHDAGSAMGQMLWLDADFYTPFAGEDGIPDGRILPVAGTPLDFTVSKTVGQDVDSGFDQIVMRGGYDHNLVLNHQEEGLRKFAVLSDPATGRVMTCYTDCPGVQLYSGNGLGNKPQKGKGGAVYGLRAGVCLETQYYPNAVNEPAFPSPVCPAGKEYDSRTVFVFSVN